jgi:hypothetical protein
MLETYTVLSGAGETRMLGSSARLMKDTGAGPIGASAGNGSSWFGLKLLTALVDVVSCRVKTITRKEMKMIREASELGARILFLLFCSPRKPRVNVPLWKLLSPLLGNFKNLDFIALHS